MTPTEHAAIEAALTVWYAPDNKWPDDFCRENRVAYRADIQRAIAAYIAAGGNVTVATLPAKPAPGFVRVRIAIAVINAENWNAAGWRNTDANLEDHVVGCLEADGNYRISFITADVPLPAPPGEIVGRVEA